MTGYRRERRRYTRVKVPLVIRVLDPTTPVDEEVAELSEAGMFKMTDAPQPLETVLAIELRAPGIADPLLIKGRVVSVVTPGEGRIAGMGIEFFDVPPSDRLKLRQIVRLARDKGATVLLVTDDQELEEMVRGLLAELGLRVFAVRGWKDVSDRPDDLKAQVVIFDLAQSRQQIDLDELRSVFAGLGIVLLCDQLTEDLHTQADAARIFEIHEKPLTADRLVSAVRTELQAQGVTELSTSQLARPLPSFVARSQKMIEVMAKIELLAQVPRPVLFTGLPGVGKAQLAKLMHRMSPQSDGPFVAIDCRKLVPGEMLVSLFGDEFGHYLWDQNKREGLVDDAADGVLYLNGIEALSLDAQEQLARVLASGFFRRKNGEHDLRCRAWIIAASELDLVGLVREGRFRKDLLYRLQVRTIQVPALAERAEDLLPLAHQILEELCLEQGRPIVSLEAEAIGQIREHSWPENVREMRRVFRESLLGASDQLQHLKISGALKRPANSEGFADRARALAQELREEARGLDLGGFAGQTFSGMASRLVSGARTLLRFAAERLRRD